MTKKYSDLKFNLHTATAMHEHKNKTIREILG